MDEDEISEELEGDNESDADLAKGYDYLLGMKIWSLTFEKAEKLWQDLEEKRRLVEDLEVTSPHETWEKDLDSLEKYLDGRDDTMDAAEKEELKAQNKSKIDRLIRKVPPQRKIE